MTRSGLSCHGQAPGEGGGTAARTRLLGEKAPPEDDDDGKMMFKTKQCWRLVPEGLARVPKKLKRNAEERPSKQSAAGEGKRNPMTDSFAPNPQFSTAGKAQVPELC